MAFPYVFQSNFESGTNAEWDTETDTTSILDFPHYKELARFPWSQCAPHRGAYCLRVKAGGQTADATLTEGDIDISAAATSYFRFYLYFGNDFTGSADDTFNLFELQQAGGTVEAVLGARIVAATGVINLGVGELAPTVWADSPILRNKWYCVELVAVCDNAGNNNGSITLYLDGGADAAATVGSLDQGAIGQGVLGIQNELATTSGTVLFDEFVQDDARIGTTVSPNPYIMTMTKSGHVFVGPGTLWEVELLSGNGTDCVVEGYDTDTADTTNGTLVFHLNNTIEGEYVPSGPMEDRRYVKGCYLVLSGTTPRALVNVCKAPTLGSKSVLRDYVRKA